MSKVIKEANNAQVKNMAATTTENKNVREEVNSSSANKKARKRIGERKRKENSKKSLVKTLSRCRKQWTKYQRIRWFDFFFSILFSFFFHLAFLFVCSICSAIFFFRRNNKVRLWCTYKLCLEDNYAETLGICTLSRCVCVCVCVRAREDEYSVLCSFNSASYSWRQGTQERMEK